MDGGLTCISFAWCCCARRAGDGRLRGNPETGTGPRENTGTLVGAVAGGLIGSQFGGGTGERVAAGIAGAAIGGLIGNRIGAGHGRRGQAARLCGADAGARNAARRARRCRGRIRIPAAMARWFPARPISRNGLQCREYTHTIYIDGRPQIARGAACRNPDGTWTRGRLTTVSPSATPAIPLESRKNHVTSS